MSMSIYRSIAEALPLGELLAQLAEECGELGAAALKLRRAAEGTNPTPVSPEAARAHLLEEIADVYVAVDVVCASLAMAGEMSAVGEIFREMERKRDRWQSRLDRARGACREACAIDGDPDRRPAEQEPPRM